MTREEAIKELTEWLDGCCGEELEPTRKALRMAVGALKIQDKLLEALNGFGSDLPCDESPDNDWCAEHCKYVEPQNDCWIRWARGAMELPLEDDKG